MIGYNNKAISDTNEMYNIFNMGIGYTVIVDEKDASRAFEDFSRTKCGSLSNWSYCEK